jgi:hypothetical protein
VILRDAHQSGRFDATDAEEGRMLGDLDKAANIGLITEAKAITDDDLPEGWDCEGDETKVVWDAAKWDLVTFAIRSIPTPTWKRGASKRDTVDITVCQMMHAKTDLTLLRLGGHLPAHLFHKAQLAANKAALDALGPLVQSLQAAHSPDVTTASFDLNRDMRRRSQRRIVREAFAGTGLHLVVPPKGTRGLRKIDALLTTAPLATAEMLPKAAGFDHRGFSVRSCGCP